MKFEIKKALLTGTALVAVAGFGQIANAADGATPVGNTTISTPTTGDDGAPVAAGTAGSTGDDGVQFGASSITVINNAAITGGAGGTGGTPLGAANNGADGGTGGAGVNLPSAQDGTSSSHPALTNNSTITGGDGGTGGDSGATNTNGGHGGTGGAGVYADSAFAVIRNNAGTIHGGDGGMGGNTAFGTTGGVGGAGGVGINIVADSVSIVNSGTIHGGNGGAGGMGTTSAGATGLIGGAIQSTGALLSITNSGHIDGNSNTAILLNNTAATIANTGFITAADDGDAFRSNLSVNLLNNNGGHITATTGIAVEQRGTDAGGLIKLTNVGGVIHSDSGKAIYTDDVIGTLDNTSGTISTDTGSAIENDGTIHTLTNAGGTISSNDDYTIRNRADGTIDLLDNRHGTITSVDGIAVANDDTITTLNNNNGVISGTDGGVAIYNSATGTIATLSNVNGTISGNTSEAIDLYGSITNAVDNTGGRITSASSDGTIRIAEDIDNLTINGGTISNTNTAADTGIAINIVHTQSHTLTLNGVTVISDGDVAGSGHGIAISSEDDATIVLDANTVIRGAIEEETDRSLDLTTSATITGDISFADNGENYLTVNGGSITGNIATGANGLTELSINGTFTTGGAITTGAGGETDLDVGAAGNFTVNHTVDLGDGTVDVSHGGTIDINGADLTTASALINHGATELGAGRTLSVGSYDNGATDGKIVLDVTGVANALTTGHIAVTDGSAADFSDQTFVVKYISGNIDTTTKSIIASGTGAAVAPTAAVTGNSYLYNFTILAGDGAAGGLTTDLYLHAARAVSLEDASDNGNNYGAASTLAGIDTTDASLTAVQNSINSAPTRAAYNDRVEATLPTIDNGSASAAAAFTGQALDITDNQLVSINTGDTTGLAAGNALAGLHPWVQGFGSHMDQSARGGVDGYNGNTFGAALGFDTRNLGEDTTLGLSFAYGRTHVNSENTNATDTNVDSYQLTAYGNRVLDNHYFVAGLASFGWDRNDETRHDVGGVAGLDADANYDAWQGAGRGEVGRNFGDGGLLGGATLTPIASVQYEHYDAQSYTESGAGGASLHVDGVTQDALNLGIGLRASWLLKNVDGFQLKPELHGSYQYDVLDSDGFDTSASFTGGGGSFSTHGLNPSNSTFNVGAGVKVLNATNWDVTATYDFTAKPDYTAHSGVLRAGYKF